MRVASSCASRARRARVTCSAPPPCHHGGGAGHIGQMPYAGRRALPPSSRSQGSAIPG